MDVLKEILLIVRPEKARETEAILLNLGAEYVLRQSVTGRGKEMGVRVFSTWFGEKRRSFPYLRKVMISALVAENILPRLLREVSKKNKTGRYGDGRAFILPLLETGVVPCR